MSCSCLSLASGAASLAGARVNATKPQGSQAPVQAVRCQAVRAAAAAAGEEAAALSRRDALALAASAAALALGPLSAEPALALGAPKGFAALEDGRDRYRFFYPFGWQEVQVKGQDVVFKDVIEPLENVAVNVIQTDKLDVKELGAPESVAQVLVDKVLTGPTQQSKLISATEKEVNGKNYYVFEFVAAAPSYKRHALGVIAIANGKFYTLTTGSNERRWRAVEEKLRAVVNSFETI